MMAGSWTKAARSPTAASHAQPSPGQPPEMGMLQDFLPHVTQWGWMRAGGPFCVLLGEQSQDAEQFPVRWVLDQGPQRAQPVELGKNPHHSCSAMSYKPFVKITQKVV